MEELLIEIGELIAMEIEEVQDIHYLDREMGYTCMLTLKDGKQVVLSLL